MPPELPPTKYGANGWRRLRPWRRHSLVVGMGGLVYVASGLVQILVPLREDRASTLVLPLRLAPIDAWGGLWLLVGALALLSTRWPPWSEVWGYTALTYLAALWSAFYALGWAFYDAPATALSGVLVWLLVGVLWWGISGLVNPEEVVAPDTLKSG